MTLADEKGNSAVIDTIDNRWTERLARTLTVDMGATSMIALYPMTGRAAEGGCVRRRDDRAGRGARAARARDAGCARRSSRRGRRAARTRGRLFRGKVVDVATADGGRVGEGRGADRGDRRRTRAPRSFSRSRTSTWSRSGTARSSCSVPDLIVVHGRRDRRADHDRGAALRVPRRRDRRPVRAGLANGGRASSWSARATSATTSTSSRSRRGSQSDLRRAPEPDVARGRAARRRGRGRARHSRVARAARPAPAAGHRRAARRALGAGRRGAAALPGGGDASRARRTLDRITSRSRAR